MDEGDRPTDSGGSAGRDEGEETDSGENPDEAADDPFDGEPERAPDEDRERSPDKTVDRAHGGDKTVNRAHGDNENSPESPGRRDVGDGEPSGPGTEPEPESEPEENEVGDASVAGDGVSADSVDTPATAAEDTGGEHQSVPHETPESDSEGSLLYRFRHDREGALMWIREMLTSVGVVLLVGLLLFGVSGVWPPMVAVESGSMEPNMQVGDLVFVTEPGQFAPDAADNDVGVVTHEAGEAADYRTFGAYGSVVIYAPPGRSGSPIIHRAMFRVSEGENWYDRADERYHNAVDCGSLAHCPAPHDGFVTLGDNNEAYDQASGLSPPVRAEWVRGVARVRVPYLGYIRLIATGQVELNEAIARTVGNSLPPAPSVSGVADAAA
ncbi:S26 family signal peptidase [Halorubrum sp. RMP-47]|uniref:S26 family signal peptidase n=1 Tax=Halorubrum miltondacostae TaxID=3076378 RepID=A0ABD5M4S3_9EURY